MIFRIQLYLQSSLLYVAFCIKQKKPPQVHHHPCYILQQLFGVKILSFSQTITVGKFSKEEVMDNQKDISKQICQSLIRGGQRCLGVKEYSPFAFSSTCLTSCRTCIMQEGEENQPWKRSNVFSHILATCVHQIWIFTDLVFFR